MHLSRLAAVHYPKTGLSRMTTYRWKKTKTSEDKKSVKISVTPTKKTVDTK